MINHDTDNLIIGSKCRPKCHNGHKESKHISESTTSLHHFVLHIRCLNTCNRDKEQHLLYLPVRKLHHPRKLCGQMKKNDNMLLPFLIYCVVNCNFLLPFWWFRYDYINLHSSAPTHVLHETIYSSEWRHNCAVKRVGVVHVMTSGNSCRTSLSFCNCRTTIWITAFNCKVNSGISIYIYINSVIYQ